MRDRGQVLIAAVGLLLAACGNGGDAGKNARGASATCAAPPATSGTGSRPQTIPALRERQSAAEAVGHAPGYE